MVQVLPNWQIDLRTLLWSDFGNHSHPVWCAARISRWSSNIHPSRAGVLNIARAHGFKAHSYADDLQIYDHSQQSSCTSLHGGPDVNLHRRNQKMDGQKSSKIKSDKDGSNLARISSAVKTLPSR